MKKILVLLLLFQTFFINVDTLLAQQRFPKPEFESGYTQPKLTAPDARGLLWEYLDIIVLIAALSLASYFALKKRSRKGIMWLSLFSLIYFGFIRNGCVCSVGSIQNITLALFNTGYTIPVTVIAFFTIPLIFTLFAGRTFCAGVCPLGAIQDFFVLRPIQIPKWLQSVLGIIPYIYLGLAILFAATDSDFIICRYDPFIGIFRFDAPFHMFILGELFLITGIFIARPYFIFLCNSARASLPGLSRT